MKIAILLATIILGAITIRWADREFLRVEPPSGLQAGWPAWLKAIHYPYRRVQNDWTWGCTAATLGVGALLAADGRTWRRPLSTGRIVGVISAVAVTWVIVQFLLSAPPFFLTNGTCYGLRNALEYQVPGAVIGAWVVAMLRPRRPKGLDWAGYLVGGMWMAKVALLIGYGPLFG